MNSFDNNNNIINFNFMDLISKKSLFIIYINK